MRKAPWPKRKRSSARSTADIEALGAATDISKLAMAIKADARIGDLAGQIANSKRDEQEARAAIDRALKALRPAVAEYARPGIDAGSAAGCR